MTLLILWSALPVISKVFCVCVLLNSNDVLLSSRETPDVWSEGMSNLSQIILSSNVLRHQVQNSNWVLNTQQASSKTKMHGTSLLSTPDQFGLVLFPSVRKNDDEKHCFLKLFGFKGSVKFKVSIWCLQISQKATKLLSGFLPPKRGPIKNYAANWLILFWLFYTTFWLLFRG